MRRAGWVARRSGPIPGRDRLPAASPSPRLERYDNFVGRPQLPCGTAGGQAGLLFSVLLIPVE